MNSKSLDRLAEAIRRSFSHVGPRQARRMALQLVQLSVEQFSEILASMKVARDRIKRCQICQDLTEDPICSLCRDQNRDKGVVAVVENPQDVAVLEAAGTFRGAYHVLHGTIDPSLKRREKTDISSSIDLLLARIENPQAKIGEVLLALDHDSDGELTSLYLAGEIRSRYPQVKLTRIGVGIPFGGEILYADPITLKRALASRTPVQNGSASSIGGTGFEPVAFRSQTGRSAS